MISAQQLQQVLNYSFLNSNNFLAPTATFIATPATYSLNNIPNSVVFTSIITPNDGVNIVWSIKNNLGITIATGTNLTPTYVHNTPEDEIGTTIFSLNVNYINDLGAAVTLVRTASITVTASACLGQLPLPSNNITIAADLVPFIGDFTNVDQNYLINLFSIVATHTGRITFVIPDSYGIVSLISDNTDTNILSQFNVVVDNSNAQKIYVSNVAITPGTYYYKFTF